MKSKYYSLKLSAIIIVVFILQIVFSDFTDLFILNENSFFQPWRFLTAIFLHGGVVHLLYNLLALVIFGLILEKFIGSFRFLIVFLATGILANLVSINFYSSSLGASGAIFGIIGALIILRPMLPVWAFGLPMPIFVAGILWGAGDILGAYGFLVGNPMGNTGNIAHLSGMLFGFIFGFLFKRIIERQKRRVNVSLDEGQVRMWEDVYLR